MNITEIKKVSYRALLEEAFDHFMGIAEELESDTYNSLIDRKILEALTLQSLLLIRRELKKLSESDFSSNLNRQM